MFEGWKTFAIYIRDDSVKRCNVYSENKFVFALEIHSVAIIVSKSLAFHLRQRFMHQCALQNHRFSKLFVVFIFTSITCQEFFL